MVRKRQAKEEGKPKEAPKQAQGGEGQQFNPLDFVPPETLRAIEDRITQVAENAADKRAEAVVNKAVEKLMAQGGPLLRQMITQQFDQLAADYHQQPQGQSPSLAGNPQMQQGGQGGRAGVMDTLMMGLAQKMTQGDSTGSANLASLTPLLVQLRAISDAFNQPRLDGMRQMAEMLTMSIKGGASPEAAAKAGIQIVDSMMPKPTPPEQK